MSEKQKYLIELFLPTAGNEGKPFSQESHQQVEKELAAKFGGVTAYPRAPASGTWKKSDAVEQQENLIVYEVMLTLLAVRCLAGAGGKPYLLLRGAQCEMTVRPERDTTPVRSPIYARGERLPRYPASW